jgi:hypothetical protein
MRSFSVKTLALITAASTGLIAGTSKASFSVLATENQFSLTPDAFGSPTVVSMTSLTGNGVGGYAVVTNNSSSASNQTNFIYGSATATAPSSLAYQSSLSIDGGANTLTNSTFVASVSPTTSLNRPSLANDGTVLYSMNGTRLNSASTPPTLAAILVKTTSSSTPALVALDGRQIGGSSSIASDYYGSYNSATNYSSLLALQVTQADDAYFYTGGISSSATVTSGSSLGSAIFRATSGGSGPDVVLKSGDTIAGSSGATVGTASGSIDTGKFSVSGDGTKYITQITSTAGNTMLVTGTPTGGATKYLAQNAATSNGNGETWQSFNAAAINNAGTVALVGSVASGYALAVNGVVQIDGYSAINPTVALNSQGDYATIWEPHQSNGGSGGVTTGQLILDGNIVASVGQVIDSQGDYLSSIVGSKPVAISDLLSDGTVDLYFLGSLNGNTSINHNTLFRETIAVAVPEPASLGFLAIASLGLLARRKPQSTRNRRALMLPVNRE